MGIKCRVWLKCFAFLHHIDDMTGKRHAAGQPRRLDAHQIDGAGRNIVPDFHLPVLNDAVFVYPFRLNARKGANLVFLENVRPQFCAFYG